MDNANILHISKICLSVQMFLMKKNINVLLHLQSYIERGLFVFTFGKDGAIVDFVHVNNLVEAHILAGKALMKANSTAVSIFNCNKFFQVFFVHSQAYNAATCLSIILTYDTSMKQQHRGKENDNKQQA